MARYVYQPKLRHRSNDGMIAEDQVVRDVALGLGEQSWRNDVTGATEVRTTPVVQLHQSRDASGGQTVDAGATTVEFDTEDVNTGGPKMGLSGFIVTLTKTGKAVIQYDVPLLNTGSDDWSFETWVEKDSGSGWVEVPGSRSYN